MGEQMNGRMQFTYKRDRRRQKNVLTEAVFISAMCVRNPEW